MNGDEFTQVYNQLYDLIQRIDELEKRLSRLEMKIDSEEE